MKQFPTWLKLSAIALFTLLISDCEKPERVIKLTTVSASLQDIGYDQVILKGEITDMGDSPATDHGIMYRNISSSVTTFTEISLGSRNSKGIFQAILNDPTPGSNYEFKAFAYAGGKSVVGGIKNFTSLSLTVPGTPTIGIATAGNAQATVTFTAPISDGGSAITGYTVTSSPDGLTAAGTASPITVTGLTNGTAYTFTVTATNVIGTSTPSTASNSVTPSTPSTTITDIDGNVYNTIDIGTQVWMKENLKTTHYADGTPLIDGTGVGSISNDYTTKYMFVYEDIESNAVTYGRLYTWAAVMNGANSSAAIPSGIQGVCPTGWHVPSISEWTQLIDYLGGESIAGGPLKEAGNSHWNYSNVGATNSSGFTGLPHGYRNSDGSFYGMGTYGAFLTSTSVNSYSSRCIMLRTENTEAYIGDYNKDDAKAIRCVMGLGAVLPTLTTTAATAKTQTTATSGGNITSDGGAVVTARGVCWSTITNPVASGSHTTDGASTGIFASSITGLTASTIYYLRAYATNSIGTAYGNELTFSTSDATVPDAPTGVSATAGNAQATVTFTPPANDGGSAITGYTVTSSPDGLTAAGTASPITVTGLTNGTAYTFTVTATNAIGTSTPSSASNSVTLPIVPDAPIIGTAIAGDAQATVTFTAPVSDGGSAITGYTVTSSPSGFIAAGTASPITVMGLTNGIAYTFTVTATNVIGTSAPSSASNSVTPAVSTVTNPTTGKIWMDKNLGASQVATSSINSASYGDIYQWGRAADGHQIRTSGTTSILSDTDTPGHALFITPTTTPSDWRSPQNDNLWQGVNGVNNPCPTGFRVPTDTEWEEEIASWSSPDAAGAYASPIKLPVAGYRQIYDGSLAAVGTSGYYWSSTVVSTNSRQLLFTSSSANVYSNSRSIGFSVRCIKDY